MRPLFFVGLAQAASRYVFFFFNDTATTEIYTLSLHDALPICDRLRSGSLRSGFVRGEIDLHARAVGVEEEDLPHRSEEHTSELQSLTNLVCRLLLEKKKTKPRC